jgi:hypothetical protein
MLPAWFEGMEKQEEEEEEEEEARELGDGDRVLLTLKLGANAHMFEARFGFV